jgi:hypothetical protein
VRVPIFVAGIVVVMAEVVHLCDFGDKCPRVPVHQRWKCRRLGDSDGRQTLAAVAYNNIEPAAVRRRGMVKGVAPGAPCKFWGSLPECPQTPHELPRAFGWL